MSFEEDTYTTIFKAMQHPIRRRILRMISEKPLTYTEIQKDLNIDNGLLNYHLDSMKDLITKDEDERYTLSEFGKATVNLVQGVEEPKPISQPRTLGLSPKQVRMLIIVLLLTLTSALGALAWSVSLNLNLANRMTQVSQDILYDDVWMKSNDLARVISAVSDSGEMNYTDVILAQTYSRELYNDFNNLRLNDPEHSNEWMKLYAGTHGLFILFNGLQNRYWVQPYKLSQEQVSVLLELKNELETIYNISDFSFSTSDIRLNISTESMSSYLGAADSLHSSLDKAFTLFGIGSYDTYMELK